MNSVIHFPDVSDDLFNYFNPKTRKLSPMISEQLHEVITKHAERLNSAIIYDRDYAFNYFGFKVFIFTCVNFYLGVCHIRLER